MRKLSAALLLPAALMTGCSMAGTGDFMTDTYAPLQQAQYGCGGNCGDAYPVAQPGVQTQHYGHNTQHSAQYGAPQTPGAHAYGQSVQGHHGHNANVPPAYAAGPRGLRGMRSAPAYAYGNLGGVMYDVDSDFFGVQGRLGYQTSKFIGAELEGSLGLTDESTETILGTATSTLDQKIDNQIAGFLVGRLPVSPKFNLLARGGYHNTEISEETTDNLGSVESDFSTDGLAYGVGAEYNLSPRTSIRADYTIYDFDGPDADAISLAIARKF